ncbi:hypothetical protein PFISCL1PPCAC_20316 [Pristionchus fissidentatus]|uniref:MATH domain-containing protein n=1 Tax=Pristionchus fissidentatus TaxID=1538716 RepID=A0AAV5WGR2_9BILA|nr:hypothetical protein PFISCL1PPCAC_20316 [Pristionchus fissidentatus]
MNEMAEIVQETNGLALTGSNLDVGSIRALVNKLMKLEVELQSITEDAERYKSELESATSTFKTVVALKNKKLQQLERELQLKNEEISLYKISRGSSISARETSPPANFETKIQARFANISKLTAVYWQSNRMKIAGADWCIIIKRVAHSIEKNDYLSVYLYLTSDDLPPGWSCGIFQGVHLISHSNQKKTHSKAGGCMTIYDAGNKLWGFEHFISFEKLLEQGTDHCKGDSILISIDINAFLSVK